MNRRSFLSRSLMLGLFYGTGAFAQDAPEYHPTQELADWFERQKRPDHDDKWLPQITSCCDAGDAYPIEILEEATFGGEAEDGSARVTDGSARNIILPDGAKKYRPAITGALTFKYAGKKRVRVYDSPDAKLRADMVRAESRMFRQAIRNGTGVEALLNSLVLGGRRG